MRSAVILEPRAATRGSNDELRSGDTPGVTRPMTYEEYLASPEERARYDIIDGYKIYYTWGQEALANPTREHQDIQGNLYESFRAWQRRTGTARTVQAPCDIQITVRPNRVRQPDLLVISTDRLALNPPRVSARPLSPAPELVAQILLPSDTRAVLAAKIADYCTVDVRECWVVAPGSQTVEVLRLSRNGDVAAAGLYGDNETAVSVVFPGLMLQVTDVFAE